MATIAALLEQIPETIWGVIIGSGLTLAGVLISNWHSARERDRERALTLKRDVYMPAVDAVMGLHALLTELADVDKPDAELTRRTVELSSKLSAIHVVGGANTVSLITSFQLRYMTAVTQIRIQRTFTKPISGRSEALIAKIQAESGASVVLSEGASRDERQKKVQAVIEGDTRELQADLSASFKLMKISLEKAGEIGDLVPPIILAFRKELGLSLDEAAYLRVWQESSAAGYGYVERLLGAVENVLKDLVAKGEGKG